MIQLESRHVAVVVPAAFILGIGLTMAFNLWHTTTTKVPATYTNGELAGKANPADIRGSYTLGDVHAAFPEVPLQDLAQAFGVKGSAEAFQVKSLEAAAEGPSGMYEIGTDSVRLFVARYLGLPYEPEATTGLTAKAVELLAATGRLDAGELNDVQARVVGAAPASAARPAAQTEGPAAATASSAPVAPAPEAAASAPVPASTEDRTVKGSTTFGQLAGWGVSKEALARILGSEPGESATRVRDYLSQKGIEFSTVKGKIQELVDAAKR